MTFESQIREYLAPLDSLYRVDVAEKGGDLAPNSAAYVVLHIDNVGLQMARDGIGAIIVQIFPIQRPRTRWPIDYLQWLIEEVSDVPPTLSNLPLQSWCAWIVKAFDSLNRALSEAELPATILAIDRIASIQGLRFNKAFAENPNILNPK